MYARRHGRASVAGVAIWLVPRILFCTGFRGVGSRILQRSRNWSYRPLNRVDAHQHYWSLKRGDYGWLSHRDGELYRDFLPADLASRFSV